MEGPILKPLLPLCLDLSSRSVVIFGGGIVGERKARLFSNYAKVTVVSKEFSPGLKQMEMGGALRLVFSDLSEGFDHFLQDAFIAIPATNDTQLNQSISRIASERGILVNEVDSAGDVVVPSIIKRGSILIAISTENPALSKHIRLKLESELNENFAEMARLLHQIRKELKEEIADQKDRSKIIWAIISDREVWRLLEVSYEKAYMRARQHVSQDE